MRHHRLRLRRDNCRAEHRQRKHTATDFVHRDTPFPESPLIFLPIS
jgi:hypothetical protein